MCKVVERIGEWNVGDNEKNFPSHATMNWARLVTINRPGIDLDLMSSMRSSILNKSGLSLAPTCRTVIYGPGVDDVEAAANRLFWRGPSFDEPIIWPKGRRAEGAEMNKDTIEGNWKELKGKVKEQWGKLTDDRLDEIAGRREQLAGKIQQAYGITRDEADKQIKDFEKNLQTLI
ncbi:CsbD family protein [Marinobacter qingdaonensis]